MKKLLGLVLVMAAALALASADTATTEDEDELSLYEAIEQSAAALAGKLPRSVRVAVVAFESPHQNLSEYIMDEIADALADYSLEVADRNNLEYAYKELGFQMSEDVSDESAQSIGRFLGARYVITGQLVHTDGRYRYRLNGVNVETVIYESSTHLDVRNDQQFQELCAALQKSTPAVRSASYDETSAPRTAGTFLDRGVMFASRGEYDMAVADFTDAIALDLDLQTAWMLRGRALYASASHVIDVGEDFSSVGVITTVGAVTSEAKKAVYDRVIADFTQALRLDPNNANAYRERGNAYNDMGEHDRAIADYNQALRLNPDYVAAYINRGNAYSDKGEHDQAIADYTQAVRINPNYTWAYNNRGLSYSDIGEYDRAIADFDEAIRIDPNYAIAYNNRGIAYDYKGDSDRAIADYSEAIRVDPNYTWAYNNRGLSYNDKGEYDRAIVDYSEAIRIDPNYVNAYNNRGAASYFKGDYARARADWEKVLQLDPDNSNAWDWLEYLRRQEY
ncbi:MAG: tetratricopeptide repeat protein [Treponema sp.]|jgi:tetratricopeptide (TPR) repeat protein|nr:tetratricopeptide repeat protein [Treponema sp.]